MYGERQNGRAMAEPELLLIQQAQRGDRAAMTELITSQQRYVYSVAMSLMRSPTDAADLTQEAFIRLMRALPSYRGETRFTTWLYRLVVNLGLDELRRRSRRGDSITLDAEEAPDPPDPSVWTDPVVQAVNEEDAARVRSAVATLPVSQRLALTLYYFEDLSYEEIAQVMGVPLNTVKSYIHRGKARLATILGDGETRQLPNTDPAPSASTTKSAGRQGLRISFAGASF